MHSVSRLITCCAAALLSFGLIAQSARAEENEFTLVIKDHRFTPAELIVPTGQKIRLVVENQDPTPEEFESYPLNREKIVPGNGRIVVFVGPLKPGKYEFFGEFNMATARGWLVAR
jgi:RPA family protein